MKITSPAPAAMTIDDVTREMQCERKTVYSLIASGQLPAIKVGRLWRIPRTGFEALLNSGAKAAS